MTRQQAQKERLLAVGRFLVLIPILLVALLVDAVTGEEYPDRID